MSDFSLTAKEQRACKLGVERFQHAHPDEEWTVTAMKGQGGMTLTVRGSRVPYATQIVVQGVLEVSDSVFTVLEQLRDRIACSTRHFPSDL
jgi:hypothetical protein